MAARPLWGERASRTVGEADARRTHAEQAVLPGRSDGGVDALPD
jgi:hypothetical protein